jgi:hypothetical protein
MRAARDCSYYYDLGVLRHGVRRESKEEANWSWQSTPRRRHNVALVEPP